MESQTAKTRRIPPVVVLVLYCIESIIIWNSRSGFIAQANPNPERFTIYRYVKTMYRYSSIRAHQDRDNGGVTVTITIRTYRTVHVRSYYTQVPRSTRRPGPKKRQKKPPLPPNPWKPLLREKKKKKKVKTNFRDGF